MDEYRGRRWVGSIAMTAVAVSVAVSVAVPSLGARAGDAVPASSVVQMRAEPRWSWPVAPPRVTEPYRAPAHEYGPGHRGIDLAAEVGTEVVAPDDGVVAFAGAVADRSLVTIDHGGGLVSTLEPVDPHVAAGARVHRGETVGVVSRGGHTRAGDLHVGARRDEAYLNPLRMLADVPRAVLLPCCDAQPGEAAATPAR